ncbi:MAG: hypothetical protein EPO63_04325 [Candidatus Nitrosotenuis sp.]|nr:MAG: hypothetical protein EPO63_04325 [Candidatus Nitrosotenuis sp.]
MTQAFRLVFSNFKYLVLATLIGIGLFMPLSVISEYMFISPYIIMSIPIDRVFGFTLIVAVSILSGIVVSMNVYRIKLLQQNKNKIGSSLFGSIVGASAGACSCGSLGFAMISTFGTIGGVATAFLSNYEIPLRIVSIGILAYTYYTTAKSLSVECKIKRYV